jgi:hypothetical protein
MDTLYVNDERFGSIYYVGTWEEWKHTMDSTFVGWYSVYYAYMHDQLYHQEPFNGQPLSYEDWVEVTLDECLSIASEEDISRYDRLIDRVAKEKNK